MKNQNLFLQSEIRKRNIDKNISKRIELLTKYRVVVNTLRSEIRIKNREKFYEKIAKKRWKFGDKGLDDKFKDFVKDTNLINKEFKLLWDYLFYFHENLNNEKMLNSLSYSRGLKYFLNGYVGSQKDIQIFINKCKEYENSKGSPVIYG